MTGQEPDPNNQSDRSSFFSPLITVCYCTLLYDQPTNLTGSRDPNTDRLRTVTFAEGTDRHLHREYDGVYAPLRIRILE